MQRLTVVLLAAFLIVGASPKRKAASSPAAPDTVPHQIALFLASLTRDGTRQVSLRATAVGTRFFFEETSGVTVYRFEHGRYVKEEFLRNANLAAATNKYVRK